MLRKEKILEEVEKTLQSFDEDIILEENPFLFTRIKTERESRASSRKKGLVFGFSLKQTLILLILLINLVTLIYNYELTRNENLREKLVLELKEDFQIDQSQSNF